MIDWKILDQDVSRGVSIVATVDGRVLMIVEVINDQAPFYWSVSDEDSRNAIAWGYAETIEEAKAKAVNAAGLAETTEKPPRPEKRDTPHEGQDGAILPFKRKPNFSKK